MAVARSEQICNCQKIHTSGRLKEERGGDRHTIVTSPHGEQNLTNIHTGNGPVGLAPCTAHSSLQSIGTST